nr:MAG TPA: hypothetical protein [Caudoviricetes sp.]
MVFKSLSPPRYCLVLQKKKQTACFCLLHNHSILFMLINLSYT